MPSDLTAEGKAKHNIREERKLGMNTGITPSLDTNQLSLDSEQPN